MGWLDRLFGRQEEPRRPAPGAGRNEPPGALSDEQALARYRYLLRTAPPETIEAAHAEAFAHLTAAQRAQVLRELAAVAPPRERVAVAAAEPDPRTLARLATRAELRQPGAMERLFGGPGGGLGMGGLMAGTIFGSLVAGFVGSAIAHAFFDQVGDGWPGEGDAGDQLAAGEPVETFDAAAEDAGDLDTDVETGDDFGDMGGEF